MVFSGVQFHEILGSLISIPEVCRLPDFLLGVLFGHTSDDINAYRRSRVRSAASRVPAGVNETPPI